MAILDNKGGIHGKAGTVVYRSYRGRTIVQGHPKLNKKQTIASKESASEFGMCSSAGRVMREAFKPAYGGGADGAFVNRMNSALYRALLASPGKGRAQRDLHDADISLIGGTEFNAGSPLYGSLLVRPQVSMTTEGKVKVSLPAITPKKDIRCGLRLSSDSSYAYRLRFMLVAFNYHEQFYEYTGLKDVVVNRWEQAEAQEWVFENQRPKGCMWVLSVSLSCLEQSGYDGGWEPVHTESWCPGALVAAWQSEDEAEPGYRAVREQEAEQLGLRWKEFDYDDMAAMRKITGLDKALNAQASRKRRQQKEMKERLTQKTPTTEAGSEPLQGKRVKF